MKIAKLNMDSQDKTRFEIHGKSSVKYHLKANHVVEAKRWFWTLNNAIQWAKDEAKEEEKRQTRHAEVLRQAKIEQTEGRSPESMSDSPGFNTYNQSSGRTLAPSSNAVPSSSGTRLSTYASRTTLESAPEDDEGSLYGSLDHTAPSNAVRRLASHATTAPDIDGDDDIDDDDGDYASSHDIPPTDKDALNITAQSTKLQLDILANIAASMQVEQSRSPSTTLSDPAVEQALVAYGAAVSSLQGLVQNLLRISRDRDAYWQYRLNREAYLRKMWEESMAKIALEHEELQSRMGESEEKRRRTKRALREALESATTGHVDGRAPSHAQTIKDDSDDAKVEAHASDVVDKCSRLTEKEPGQSLNHKQSTLSQINNLCDSGSDDDDDDEFFDAIDSGEIEVEKLSSVPSDDDGRESPDEGSELRAIKRKEIIPSFTGYDESVRERLKMDYDNRPKISLWVSNSSTTHCIRNLTFVNAHNNYRVF